jgi:hypothetical protein
MKAFARSFAIVGHFSVVLAVLPASAQGLIAFYQVGGDKTEWVRWDTYVVDSDSLKVDGALIRYKSFRIGTNGSEPPQEIKADCATHRRGLVTSPDLYATYPGTIGGEEVKVACALAEKRGLREK